MHGKIGQLSLDESLALQAKESRRRQLEILARQQREEAETLAAAADAAAASHPRQRQHLRSARPPQTL